MSPFVPLRGADYVRGFRLDFSVQLDAQVR
jgi:hypothetical protein